MKNIMKKVGFGSVVAATVAAPATAMAALPESVTSSISAAQADGVSAGWLVVGAFAAIFTIKLVKRFF
ncbi:hypothetical protein J2T38_002299 [Neisseria perflava]|uniref:major capsid protein n=1 Tax=Neisseria perflava TaxID=33053 RepID=UPI00209DDA54|nr:major capsid protein [Neisseria perflava]MCP1773445.1 hypothetical protein [Neisseria perflava]